MLQVIGWEESDAIKIEELVKGFLYLGRAFRI